MADIGVRVHSEINPTRCPTVEVGRCLNRLVHPAATSVPDSRHYKVGDLLCAMRVTQNVKCPINTVYRPPIPLSWRRMNFDKCVENFAWIQ